MQNIVMLLKGALSAEEKVELKMNVSERSFKRVMSLLLPCTRRPYLRFQIRVGMSLK